MPAITVTVDWQKWDTINTRLSRLSLPVQAFARGQIEQTLQSLTEGTPRSSGQQQHLGDNWTSREEPGGGPLQIVMFNALKNKEDILRYMEYGTKPHVIKPKNKKWMTFVWKGSKCFAKIVNHPGTRPYGMISTARAELQSRINGLSREVLQEIKNEFERV